MGESTIKAALTYYLNEHEFGNAETNDLWSAISEKWDSMRSTSVSRYTDFNFTVQEMMDTWTLQMGYPIGELMPYFLSKKAKAYKINRAIQGSEKYDSKVA